MEVIKQKICKKEKLEELRKEIETQAKKVRDMRNNCEGAWRNNEEIMKEIVKLMELKHLDPKYLKEEYGMKTPTTIKLRWYIITDDLSAKKLQVSIFAKTSLKGEEIKEIIKNHTKKLYPDVDPFETFQLINKDSKKKDNKELKDPESKENDNKEANQAAVQKVPKKKKTEKILTLPTKKEYPLVELIDTDKLSLPLIFPGPKLDSSIVFNFRCSNKKMDELENKAKEKTQENKKILVEKFNNKKPKEKSNRKKVVKNRRIKKK
eukprot:TRINITY_DN12233_c0_g1_i1.p1 TRINITY_DN12233_c0_g1~~TRINITY_DN12233_c0_g1_i1.p1  ORF type:complete len:264 (-),score=107.48 TRINITY_DN12233_c0_g1_i1:32-823(-)